jgi:hypothetical protein
MRFLIGSNRKSEGLGLLAAKRSAGDLRLLILSFGDPALEAGFVAVPPSL